MLKEMFKSQFRSGNIVSARLDDTSYFAANKDDAINLSAVEQYAAGLRAHDRNNGYIVQVVAY